MKKCAIKMYLVVHCVSALGCGKELAMMSTEAITNEQIVMAQLDAYNRKDLDECFRYFSDDFKVYTLPEGNVLFDGKEATRQHVENSIESGSYRQSKALERIINGSYITLLEQKGEGETATRITITYFVKDGLIRAMWAAIEKPDA